MLSKSHMILSRMLSQVIIVAAALGNVSYTNAASAAKPIAARPALLVIGSVHFSNPGRDVINVSVDDVFSERRQREIQSVVSQLAAFKPTHVAVEWPSKAQAALDKHYDAYIRGTESLSRREAEQLGIRLAAAAGLRRIYAVDWNEVPTGNPIDFDWVEYGQSHGQGEQVRQLMDPTRFAWLTPLQSQPMIPWLLELNRPESLAANHRTYFEVSRIGDSDHQPGATWVGQWYARNLRIFNNIVDLTADPRSRVVVIYGQGHAYLLREFAKESGAFSTVDLSSVLKP